MPGCVLRTQALRSHLACIPVPRCRRSELADSKYVQEEALYRVAVGSWRMGDFEQSKAYLGELLQINPQHRAAVAFIGVYEESMWHR